MNAVMKQPQMSNHEDLVMACAEDSILYSQVFFSRAIRQESPVFHTTMWDAMEDTNNRFVNLKVFRGGAKTTLARIFMSKRVAYAISRTILIIGKSETAAVRSVEWIMKQVEYNSKWAQSYGLKPGSKWTAGECEIINEFAGCSIRIIALGITGSVRGINVDDYRPDLIIVDDPCDEENTATPEGRDKMVRFFFGAIKESLAPISESPEAMMLLLQTPLEEDDLTDLCSKDKTWVTMSFPCLTSEDDKEAESMWPARWSKEVLLAEKHHAIDVNQLSLWMREKMVTITSRELTVFNADWLDYWTVLPEGARYMGAIDPAPVLSDKMRQKANPNTDYQVVMVKAYWRGHAYLVDYVQARDSDPDEVCNFMYNANRKYPMLGWGVETNAYQRTLKWYIEKKIKERKLQPKRIIDLATRTDKFQRIVQAHTDRASNGMFHVNERHHEFIAQFESYHQGYRWRDLLDCSALCDEAMSPALENSIEGDFEVLRESERHIPELELHRQCP